MMQQVPGYMYNEDTKVFTSEVTVDADPLESRLQGRFIPLLPANCTLTPPPAEDKEGFDKCWDVESNAWVYKEKPKEPEPEVYEPSELDKAYDALYDAQRKLDGTDYRILKCFEAFMTQKEMPYDIEALVAERDGWRDDVNAAQDKVDSLRAEQDEVEPATDPAVAEVEKATIEPVALTAVAAKPIAAVPVIDEPAVATTEELAAEATTPKKRTRKKAAATAETAAE